MIEEYNPEPLLGPRSKQIAKLAAFALILLVGIVLVAPTQDKVVTTTRTAPPTYTPSTEIASYATTVGLPSGALEATQPIITSQTVGLCDPKYFIACYDPNTERIFIYPAALSANPAASLAYEYAHHVWKHLTQSQKTLLEPELMQLYLASPNMQKTFEPIIRLEGAPGSDAFYDEVHSAACTEMSDAKLSPQLLAQCSLIASNRNNLPSLF